MIILVICGTLFYIYIIFSFVRRIHTNKKYDRKLKIETQGYRNWDKNGLYNRTESTPYLALERLTEVYQVNQDDHLIDFGCGKGRVLIYLYDIWKIPVTGLELNQLTYEELTNNIKSYQGELSGLGELENKDGISVIKEYAEKYEISKEENKFFFFNPFSVEIFAKTVENIIKNANMYNKTVEIILYYPMNSYQVYLRETPFKLVQEIKVSSSILPREKFKIYRYEGKGDNDKGN